jgi:two-component sensor histidine kinase
LSWQVFRPFNGLAARVAGTLALALLPIGAIAIFQAIEISRDDARRQDTALLTATAEAAADEALAVANAGGAAATLAAYMAGHSGAHAGCSTFFENVVERSAQFSFAGFVGPEGTILCGSQSVGHDMSGGVVFPRMQAQPAPMVVANPAGPLSGTSVIISATPVFAGETYLGFVAVVVPHRRIPDILSEQASEAVTDLITFNAEGEPLSSSAGFDGVEALLPAGQPLASLVSNHQTTFSGHTQAGEARSFAVVPIIPGGVYALGSQLRSSVGRATVSAALFPTLMLLAGLIVAFGAVDRLVIRHIHELTRHLAEFSRSRRVLPLSGRHRLTRELAEIDAAWTNLAEQLLRDEAELENTVHEKNVLLKEVHHRVKNNLQLISSIVNLKIRRATSDEARRKLQEVYARVMSIASVHQSLYTNPAAGKVRADELLTTVIGGIVEAGSASDRPIAVTQSYDPVQLYPDQAVPFLLLASEAVTNALKHMGRPAQGQARLEIALANRDDGQAELTVINTNGTPFHPPEQVKGSGLGRALIASFATQLGGRMRVDESDELYGFHLVFSPVPFDAAERDHSVADIEETPPASST